MIWKTKLAEFNDNKSSIQAVTYASAGVNINNANEAKTVMRNSLTSLDPRILNNMGDFASLVDLTMPNLNHPIVVFKTEEPGTKQKFAIENRSYHSICFDLVHHLINDIIVMGAIPVVMQDAIICGRLDREIVTKMVSALAEACNTQGCSLTGGETSEQPGVLDEGVYVLTGSLIGIVEKSKIIDGHLIKPGDSILALASNGVHTNGYSLIRHLIKTNSDFLDDRIEGISVRDVLLRPHRCYLSALRECLELGSIHGLAHITGGGIEDNLKRIIPEDLCGNIDLSLVKTLEIFRVISKAGTIPDQEMLKVFNMGVGILAVVESGEENRIQKSIQASGVECYRVGHISSKKDSKSKDIIFSNKLVW